MNWLQNTRLSLSFSGFPESVPVYTVNRQCSSGLQALFNIAGKNCNSTCKMACLLMQVFV